MIDSLPSANENARRASTMDVDPRPAADQWPKFWHSGLLSDPDDAERTEISHLNGHSNASPVNLGHFLVLTPPPQVPQEFFRAIQKWEGHVTHVGKDTFWARLTPIIGEGPDQEAEVYAQEVDSADRLLIELGAVFYWSIGYLDRPAGRLRVSTIRFRRLPIWTKLDVDRAETEAGKSADLFNAE